MAQISVRILLNLVRFSIYAAASACLWLALNPEGGSSALLAVPALAMTGATIHGLAATGAIGF